MRQRDLFSTAAKKVARWTGNPLAFILACTIVVVWGVSGPIFQFSETWQLVINTGTTIITFLMIFLIQNTQNRDSEAMQIKLDELIRATKGHNRLMDLEELSPEELEKIKQRYEDLAEEARRKKAAGVSDCDDTDSPEVDCE